MSQKLPSSLLLLCSLGIAGVGTGCFSPTLPTTPLAARLVGSERSFSQSLPAPTKDEVALIDGRPFSITGYLALRSQLRTRTSEAVFWVGSAALAIQNSTRARGHELQTPVAVDIARYALGELNAAEADNSLRQYFERRGLPPTSMEVRREVDRLLSLAVVQRNDRVLRSLNQP